MYMLPFKCNICLMPLSNVRFYYVAVLQEVILTSSFCFLFVVAVSGSFLGEETYSESIANHFFSYFFLYQSWTTITHLFASTKKDNKPKEIKKTMLARDLCKFSSTRGKHSSTVLCVVNEKYLFYHTSTSGA